jgi:multidrug resistance protein
MPTGDLESQAATFHVGNEAIFLSISLFVLGFGIGPLLFAPLSEMVGRKPIYLISMFFFFIFTLPSCLAKNLATMLAARMIAGIAASAPMTNVGGSIADVWATEERGIPMAIFSSTIFLGPCLGPLFGGWMAVKTHQWRWIYWVLFIFIGFIFIITLFTSETLEAVILRRKAARLNKENNTDVYISKHDVNRTGLAQSMKVAMTRPFVLMFLEPIILFMSFYLSFIYALLYALFFAFPIAFEEIRHWNAGMTGVAFVSIILGMLIAMALMPVQERLYAKHCEKHGRKPEARLYPMMLGSIILPIALFIFAFTSYEGVHWIGPMVAGTLFGIAMIMIYISANSYIVDSYSNFAASAVAAKTLMRSTVGATVPLWVTQMFHNMGFQYAGLLIALISVVIAFIPYLFFFKGGAIRERSTRAVKE